MGKKGDYVTLNVVRLLVSDYISETDDLMEKQELLK